MSKGTVNKVILIGRLGKDPEVRSTPNGTKVASVSLATNYSYKTGNGDMQENTEWHNLVLWGARADFAEKYLKKGMRIYVDGRLQTRKWDDKNGVTHYSTEIVVNETQILESSGNRSESYSSAPQASEKADNFQDLPTDMGAPGDSNDDIPF